MNKSDLIEYIARHGDMTKAMASRAVDSYHAAVKMYLKRGGSVALAGFGIYKATKRSARIGRNPRTGAVIKIKACRVPKFQPSKTLKDALN